MTKTEQPIEWRKMDNLRRHKLLPVELAVLLPPLYSCDGVAPELVKVPLKVFNPYGGGGTWYLWEYDPVERLLYGLCYIFEWEYGYVSLDELMLTTIKFGGCELPLERDKSWPKDSTLAKVKELCHV